MRYEIFPGIGVNEIRFGQPIDDGVEALELEMDPVREEWRCLRVGDVEVMVDEGDRVGAIRLAPSVPVVISGILLAGQMYRNVANLLYALDADLDMGETGAWSEVLGLIVLSKGASATRVRRWIG